MGTQRSRNDYALRVLQAKNQIGKYCPYCSGEHKFTKSRQSDILVAVCSSCGGRAKDRYDRGGNKLPPVEIVVVAHV